MKKKHRKLSVVLIVGIVTSLLMLSAIIAVIGYQGFTRVLEQQYNDTAYEVAETARSYLNPDKFAEYLSTGETDEEYEEILEKLDALTITGNCNFIYVAHIDREDMATTYIYDSVDPDLGFDRYELGTTAYDLDPQYREDLEHILDTGDRAEKYLYSYSESGAHTTAGLGVRDGNGKVVAVVGVEKPMTILESARSTYVKQVAFIATMVVLLTIAGYLFWLNNILIAPIAEITGEARRFADNSRAPSRPLKAVE